jgi:hypothetical protein
MDVLLLQLDGKLPNLALMRLAAHHRGRGDRVVLRRAGNSRSLQPQFDDPAWERVYGSLIFQSTRPLAEEARRVYPGAVLGGTGWDRPNDAPRFITSLEALGVHSQDVDYADYPTYRPSLGFTQRGCRLRCAFCVVPHKEGKVRAVGTIADIWRGDPWPREIHLLDNDFFGQAGWKDRIDELRSGGFRVSFNQGINARFLSDEAAAAVGSVDYRDDSMKVKRIYTAWDNRADGRTLFRGLRALVRYGVKPDHIMVYMLIGFDHATESARDMLTVDDFARRDQLREFGCRPYPMPYVRTPELVGFQRWVIGAYDKAVPWSVWKVARYRPERLRLAAVETSLLDAAVDPHADSTGKPSTRDEIR